MTEHALILCREPGRHSTLDKGHEEGGSAYANAGSAINGGKATGVLPSVVSRGFVPAHLRGREPPTFRYALD